MNSSKLQKPSNPVAADSVRNSVLIEFQKIEELRNWIVVNDTVMGGRSDADIMIKDNRLLFSGNLSLENNGGFASVRRVKNKKTWESGRAIKLEVKGDGREYQLRFRTVQRMDDISYVAKFQTVANEERTFEFHATDFIPQFRGSVVPDAPKFDFSNIAHVGFLLADGEPGEFLLKVERIFQILK